MFIKRTSLKQIRIVYLVYFLMFSRVARSLVRVQIVFPWLAIYVFSMEWYSVVRYCAVAYSLYGFVSMLYAILSMPSLSLMNCFPQLLLGLLPAAATIFYWPAKKELPTQKTKKKDKDSKKRKA